MENQIAAKEHSNGSQRFDQCSGESNRCQEHLKYDKQQLAQFESGLSYFQNKKSQERSQGQLSSNQSHQKLTENNYLNHPSAVRPLNSHQKKQKGMLYQPLSLTFDSKRSHRPVKYQRINYRKREIKLDSMNRLGTRQSGSKSYGFQIQAAQMIRIPKSGIRERTIQKDRKAELGVNQVLLSQMSHLSQTGCPTKQVVEPYWQKFMERFPFFFENNAVLYPVQDELFLEYPDILVPSLNVSASPLLQFLPLPPYYHNLLEVWNLLRQYGPYFECVKPFTIRELQSIILEASQPYFILIFVRLHDILVNELLHHLREEDMDPKDLNFIHLLRYSQECRFIYPLMTQQWPMIGLLAIKMLLGYQERKIQTQEKLSALKKLLESKINSGSFTPFENPYYRFDYLGLLVQISLQTSVFRNLLDKKIQTNRLNNRAKNQLFENKKNIEHALNKIKQELKNLAKKEKNFHKMMKFDRKNGSEVNNESAGILEQLEQEKESLLSNKCRLENQLVDQNCKIEKLSGSTDLSLIWLLGQDRTGNIYWLTADSSDIVYVQKADKEWGFQNMEQLYATVNRLNLRGIHDSRLHERILQFKRLNLLASSTSSPEDRSSSFGLKNLGSIQTHQSSVCEAYPSSNFIQTSFKSESARKCKKQRETFELTSFREVSLKGVFQIAIRCQQLMEKYLSERNAKWTQDTLRQDYIDKMSSESVPLAMLVDELKSFNEKICVVQIQCMEQTDEMQNIISTGQMKIRRIQTKLWGINEKYKHVWYHYSEQCDSVHDLYFLVSVIFLTIEKYVNKTRKPTHTKYFKKSVESVDKEEKVATGDAEEEEDEARWNRLRQSEEDRISEDNNSKEEISKKQDPSIY